MCCVVDEVLATVDDADRDGGSDVKPFERELDESEGCCVGRCDGGGSDTFEEEDNDDDDDDTEIEVSVDEEC